MIQGPDTSDSFGLPVHPDAVAHCTECSCLCHDVRFDEANPDFHDCDRARWRFAGLGSENSRFSYTDEDIARATEWLVEAVQFNRTIAFTGLGTASYESQKQAVALAESVGAWVVRFGELGHERSHWSTTQAQKGCVSATWSEIRQRSDALLLWYAPLWDSHPRWLERFGPRSERAHRLAVLPPMEPEPESGWNSDQIVRVDPGQACEFLRAVQAALQPGANEPEDASVRRVVHTIRNARWLAIVRSDDPPGLSDSFGVAETFANLVVVANEQGRRRVVSTHVPNAINDAGLEAILSIRVGMTTPFRFSPEGPVRNSGEWSGDDVELFVYFFPISRPEEQMPRISGSESIQRTEKSVLGKVQRWISIPHLAYGTDASGTLIRNDGVPIPVRGLIEGNSSGLPGFLRAVRKAVLGRVAAIAPGQEPGLRHDERQPGASR